jgi:hypothetical protein
MLIEQGQSLATRRSILASLAVGFFVATLYLMFVEEYRYLDNGYRRADLLARYVASQGTNIKLQIRKTPYV